MKGGNILWVIRILHEHCYTKTSGLFGERKEWTPCRGLKRQWTNNVWGEIYIKKLGGHRCSADTQVVQTITPAGWGSLSLLKSVTLPVIGFHIYHRGKTQSKRLYMDRVGHERVLLHRQFKDYQTIWLERFISLYVGWYSKMLYIQEHANGNMGL